MKKFFALDVLLFALFVICLVTGILLDFHLIPGGKEASRPFKLVHTYSGYLMAAGLAVHLIWHKDWIGRVAKKFIGRN